MKQYAITILKEANIRVPRKQLEHIYNDTLKKKMSLNVIFTNGSSIKKLNKEFRNKNYTPNILTFPNTDIPSEIYINAPMAKKEAHQNEVSLREHILFLFIHGTLHLLGNAHGKQMDTLEDIYSKKYIYNK